ncbi:MAG: hypothetical protein Q9165_004623 [Trypethelium subeluteriae]
MTPRRIHRPPHQRHHSNLNQVSDYETDTAILTDTGLPQDPPPPSRTNEELNLAVLKRHNPSIIAILSIAPYAVVYKFSAIGSIWEKRGVEGTLFVVQLLPEQLEYDQSSTLDRSAISVARFGVVVLNRRGLDNFEAGLKSAEDVEVTEEYVILQVGREPSARAHENGAMQEGEPDIIGLWIFAEPPPSSTAQARILNAQIIQECAKQAEISRKAAEETLEQIRQEQARFSDANGQANQPEDSAERDVGGAPMGRQLSLRQLFGQQRQDDDAWSIRGHHSPPLPSTQHDLKYEGVSNPFHPTTLMRISSQQPLSQPTQLSRAHDMGTQPLTSTQNHGLQNAMQQVQGPFQQQTHDPTRGLSTPSTGNQRDELLNLFQRARATRR